MTSAARLLRLLTVLQERRDWTGPQLAEELEVSTRTVRQDFERLRDLGYPIEAQAGVGGGYRLGAGSALPPLMFDDDEAVAIAVGLRTAAAATLTGIEGASVRALAKLEQVLPSRLSRRIETLSRHIVPLGGGGPVVDPGLLVQIASACRDREGLHFTYRTFAGERLRRILDPHELVSLGRFWYLVAYDHAREDWRTFRLDRIDGTPSAGRRFTRRPPPPGGFAAHVARNRSPTRDRYPAEIMLHAPLDELTQRVPPSFGTLTAVDNARTLLRTEGDWLGAIAIHVALIGVDFGVITPAALAHQVADLADRFGRARALTSLADNANTSLLGGANGEVAESAVD